jgi:hypothetical protein
MKSIAVATGEKWVTQRRWRVIKLFKLGVGKKGKNLSPVFMLQTETRNQSMFGNNTKQLFFA